MATKAGAAVHPGGQRVMGNPVALGYAEGQRESDRNAHAIPPPPSTAIAATLSAREHENRMTQIAGQDAFDPAKAFNHWLQQHPAKDSILAYLNDPQAGSYASSP